MIRRANRRDANEREIVRALESVGAFVYRLDTPVDLLVGYQGRTYLLEVKRPPGPRGGTGDRKLTPAQRAFVSAWRGRPVVVVTTPSEAITAIGARTC